MSLTSHNRIINGNYAERGASIPILLNLGYVVEERILSPE